MAELLSEINCLVQNVHLWISLPNPPDSLVDVLQKTVYEFVWLRKQDRINRKTMIKTFTMGGLWISNSRDYVNALKLIWKQNKRHVITNGKM